MEAVSDVRYSLLFIFIVLTVTPLYLFFTGLKSNNHAEKLRVFLSFAVR